MAAPSSPSPGAGDGAPPAYTLYRSRPSLFGSRGRQERPEPLGAPRPGRNRARVALRVVVALVAAVLAWVLLSLVLFLVSAQIERAKVTGAAQAALDPGGFPLFSANTILVLGSDARTKGTKEAGANPGGPSRSDTILLMRAGGRSSARLAIPRDSIADIPGHGRQKINAAYAFGGAALTVKTVKGFLGTDVNHVVEVSFENFPKFIDALGGVDVTTGRVISNINGGKRNGGQTLRLSKGEHHLDGKQALALARTRKNEAKPKEGDEQRAARQQLILSAMKSRLTSPSTFLRLPFVAWQAPKAIRTDMGGFSLLGLFGSVATSSSPPPRVLRGSPAMLNGQDVIEVPDGEKRSALRRLLKG